MAAETRRAKKRRRGESRPRGARGARRATDEKRDPARGARAGAELTARHRSLVALTTVRTNAPALRPRRALPAHAQPSRAAAQERVGRLRRAPFFTLRYERRGALAAARSPSRYIEGSRRAGAAHSGCALLDRVVAASTAKKPSPPAPGTPKRRRIAAAAPWPARRGRRLRARSAACSKACRARSSASRCCRAWAGAKARHVHGVRGLRRLRTS